MVCSAAASLSRNDHQCAATINWVIVYWKEKPAVMAAGIKNLGFSILLYCGWGGGGGRGAKGLHLMSDPWEVQRHYIKRQCNTMWMTTF
jgi:hypothetical protein